MADPFAAALGALFGAAGSAAAVYTPVGGVPLADPIRVIIGSADQLRDFQDGQVVAPTPRAEIRKIEVPAPANGDTIDLLADDGVTVTASYRLLGKPVGDVEGQTWFADVELI